MKKAILFLVYSMLVCLQYGCKDKLVSANTIKNTQKLTTTADFILSDTTIAVVNVPQQSTEEKDILDDNDYIREVQLDTVFESSDFSEYIAQGLMSFNTCKTVQPWLSFLEKQVGKPDSVKESYRKTYYWHKRNFLNFEKITIFCEVQEVEKPAYFDIDLTFLDKDLQLIADTVFLTAVKTQIKQLVFSQKTVKMYQPTQQHISTIGKHPYMSFWRDFFPKNYDSVMLLMANDEKIKLNWDEIEIKCLVDTAGKIVKWKVHDAENGEYETQFQQQFANYKTLFSYPILYSPNKEKRKIFYKAQFKLNNILEDSLNSAASLNVVLNDLQKGKYKKTSSRGKASKENKTQAGNTTFFSVERNGFEPVMANIPFGEKTYSFFFDQLGGKLYTINKEKMDSGKQKQQWKLKQSINIGDFEGGTLDIADLDQDGFGDLILSSSPNMNGNSWADVYMYHADKDSFLLGVENFCCINSESNDDRYKSNKKYYITSYGGSWYMPITTSIYSWQDKTLQLELIIGTELLRRDMGNLDYSIFFVMERINGKLELIKQINVDASKKFADEASKTTQFLLEEYLSK
jgi:hypothetical protein